jgi:hypothetical protein
LKTSVEIQRTEPFSSAKHFLVFAPKSFHPSLHLLLQRHREIRHEPATGTSSPISGYPAKSHRAFSISGSARRIQRPKHRTVTSCPSRTTTTADQRSPSTVSFLSFFSIFPLDFLSKSGFSSCFWMRFGPFSALVVGFFICLCLSLILALLAFNHVQSVRLTLSLNLNLLKK